MFARASANAYAQVGVQTGAMSASPHKLIAMLYDGARAAIARAKFHLEGGNVIERGNAISKAIDIIDNGLRAVLDHEVGGEISANLESLYEYMVRRLMLANLRSDAALLAEVDTLLESLASAWAQIDDTAADRQPALQDN
ncbi:flagellar export chaperone FliS [Cupriavidus necator]|uniref:Flagellar secretion chaperone FliS n=1 Tax=Cupriavidus necator (strain ATCC 17699 / DSM 428 / KCTC 22496 / NCIMB 10442 / H16 / Stanier 337) TaxID=381666 RepID=Q0JYM9_CUPNH|nr:MULTISPECIES: flagellar export chaperone FliS [Cupriavidus]EON19992.1 flagellar protein FliS [Cupriavidus sp. GA3-3]KUE88414.1 flagellar protein FliS [Cupriavidus necator]QCC04916.1 flagellar export chaperone FliS [Cupriavidus necator H16]QQB79603.1 flagellar export chaperone FliS [Cupriavidus necator]WKA43846.1 flagellar export chaperone FliS [Cupriavidus necator]